MVSLLAKNAVQIKCNFENACMTGNYECAYALGILNYNLGLEKIADYENLVQLKEMILEAAEEYQPEEQKLLQMIHILKEYEPSEEMDNQMRALFDMGFTDKKL